MLVVITSEAENWSVPCCRLRQFWVVNKKIQDKIYLHQLFFL